MHLGWMIIHHNLRCKPMCLIRTNLVHIQIWMFIINGMAYSQEKLLCDYAPGIILCSDLTSCIAINCNILRMDTVVCSNTTVCAWSKVWFSAGTIDIIQPYLSSARPIPTESIAHIELFYITGETCTCNTHSFFLFCCTGFCRILVTLYYISELSNFFYESFWALNIPYNEVTELWVPIQRCKDSAKHCTNLLMSHWYRLYLLKSHCMYIVELNTVKIAAFWSLVHVWVSWTANTFWCGECSG